MRQPRGLGSHISVFRNTINQRPSKRTGVIQPENISNWVSPARRYFYQNMSPYRVHLCVMRVLGLDVTIVIFGLSDSNVTVVFPS